MSVVLQAHFSDSLPFSQENKSYPWHAIHTRSNHEKLAVANLVDRGFQPFLPSYRARRHWSDRMVIAEIPLFPGYVFCRFDHALRSPVVSAPGVVSVVGCGNQAAPIPDPEIDAVRAIVSSCMACQPIPFLQEGQRVRVTSGPLQSLEGILLRKKSSCSLIVSVLMLQRSVSVEIDPAHIQTI